MKVTENRPKDIIFISHATPEDNEIAIWIASCLESAGYIGLIRMN